MNQTDNLPDFISYGYQVLKELKLDRKTGCITWLAKATSTDSNVVIKQFSFATPNSSWLGYEAFKQEVELLKNLNHPAIPQYLASFETEDSFCFVIEYIVGKSLGKTTNITEKLCKLIAVRILDVLIYLQQQHPPIFHLNITPNTVLLDKKNNVYLLDFAYIRANNINPSLIKISNAEFIAPEQLNNPNKASDIYSLGCTLRSVINNCQSLSLSFEDRDDGFLEWLDTTTELEIDKRYPDAETALQALKASLWEDIDDPIVQTSELSALSQKAFAAGIFALIILGFAIAFGINVTQKVTELSFINVAIALMGGIIIFITQSASATTILNSNGEKKQGTIVSVSIPLVMTIITGIIFGKGEAVAMSLAAVLAQTMGITYVLWQKLSLTRSSDIQKIAGFIIAIAIGLYMGTALLKY